MNRLSARFVGFLLLLRINSTGDLYMYEQSNLKTIMPYPLSVGAAT